MTITYRIVQHDGGWAYQLGDSYSETFPSHAAALAAAVAARPPPSRTEPQPFRAAA